MAMQMKVQNVFLIYALIFGLLLVFLTPPLNVPDENAHFVNAYSVSQGALWGKVVDGKFIREVPAKIKDFSQKYPGRFEWNHAEKISYKEIWEEAEIINDSDKTVMWEGTIISPVGYIVAASGMAIGSCFGKLFGMGSVATLPYNQMIFGRLANLFFYIIVTFYALKIIPYYKRTLLLLASMPMTVFLCASLNYDAILIPVSFLFIATILKLINQREKKINEIEIATILFCVFFLVGVKLVYAPLLILLLIIPKTKYGKKRNLIICVCSAIIVGLVALTPEIVNRRLGSLADPTTNAPIVEAQKEWVMNNLFKLPGLLVHSFIMEKGSYLEQFWGRLGWLDTYIPKPLVVFGLLIILIVTVIETCNASVFRRNEWWKRVILLLAILISITGTMLAMYIAWTPLPYVTNTIGGSIIKGVQGRYFIPAFLPFCVIFANKLLSSVKANRCVCVSKMKTIKTKFDGAIIFWSFICGLITVLIVLVRYWI